MEASLAIHNENSKDIFGEYIHKYYYNQSKQIQRPAVLDQRTSSFFCASVKETGASHSVFFRYNEEIVDCGKPERSAS